AIRAYALESLEPATLLDRLDGFLASAEVDTFATLLHATYDPETRELVLVQAGHLPPVLVDADGEAEFLHLASQPPIGRGLLASGQPEPISMALSPGATVLLYTDGLIERRGEVIDDGLARLLEHAAGTAHLAPEELCDHLLDKLA